MKIINKLFVSSVAVFVITGFLIPVYAFAGNKPTVEFVDSSVEVFDGGGFSQSALYEVTFSVTASTSDIYFPKDADRMVDNATTTNFGDNGSIYVIQNSGVLSDIGSTTYAIVGGGDIVDLGDDWLIESGNTGTFTLSVYYWPLEDGIYRMGIGFLQFHTGNPSRLNAMRTIGELHTDYVFLDF